MFGLLAQTQEVSFPPSVFVPLALGFFGLGTGYLIYGPQELFKLPGRDRAVDLATGIWGVWMPGFLQFLTGVILFVGLAWFHSFRAPALYMTALAFTAYGVHWWALGMSRALGGDPRPNAFMSIPFTTISALGIVVFFLAHDAPVAGLFIGLTCVYVSEFFSSLYASPVAVQPGRADGQVHEPVASRGRRELGASAERALGFFHLATGLWLMYLTWATVLNIASGYHLYHLPLEEQMSYSTKEGGGMPANPLSKILYTAEAVIEGGRAGHGRTSDGRLDVQLSVPEDMGGQGGPGTNPEQLFAVGYGACFQSALLGVAQGRKLDASDSQISSRVGIGPTGHGGFGLQVSLDLHAPHLSPAEAADLMARADWRCPYSNATRGNIQVTLSVDGTPIERAAARPA